MFGFSFLCQSHPLFISCLGQQHSLKKTFRNQSSRTSTHQYGNNMLSQQYFVAISSIACVLKYWLFETTYPLFTTVNNFKYLCQFSSVEALYEMQSHLYEITTPAQFLPVNDWFVSLGTYQTIPRVTLFPHFDEWKIAWMLECLKPPATRSGYQHRKHHCPTLSLWGECIMTGGFFSQRASSMASGFHVVLWSGYLSKLLATATS